MASSADDTRRTNNEKQASLTADQNAAKDPNTVGRKPESQPMQNETRASTAGESSSKRARNLEQEAVGKLGKHLNRKKGNLKAVLKDFDREEEKKLSEENDKGQEQNESPAEESDDLTSKSIGAMLVYNSDTGRWYKDFVSKAATRAPELRKKNPEDKLRVKELELIQSRADRQSRAQQESEHEQELLKFQDEFEELQKTNDSLNGRAFERLQEEGKAIFATTQSLRKENAELKSRLQHLQTSRSAKEVESTGLHDKEDEEEKAKPRRKRSKRIMGLDVEIPEIP